MLLRRVTEDGADLVMLARRDEKNLRQSLDGLLFVRAGGFWLAPNGDTIFLNTASAPVEKIGTRQVLIRLREGSVWVKPADGAYIDFTFEPANRMPSMVTVAKRGAQRRSAER